MKEKGARRGGAKTKGGKGKKEKGRAVGSGGGVRVAGNRDTLPPSPVQAVPTGVTTGVSCVEAPAALFPGSWMPRWVGGAEPFYSRREFL